MKILNIVLPITLAERVKRQVPIGSLEEAFGEFVLNANVRTHGCHCAGLADKTAFIGGEAIDDLDRLCNQWKSARQCQGLDNGKCVGGQNSAYEFDNVDCESIIDECQQMTCMIDKTFSDKINEFVTNTPPASWETGLTEANCTANLKVGFDSCCGSEPLNFKRFVSGTDRCENDVVEPCPVNSFSLNGSNSPEDCMCDEGFHKVDVSPSLSQVVEECTACPAGTEGDGSGGCQTCPENQYSEDGLSGCTYCPANSVSPAGSTSIGDCSCASDSTLENGICVPNTIITCPAGQELKADSSGCRNCGQNQFSVAGGSCQDCNSVADILIVLDGSGSMSRNGKWNLQRNAIKNFASKFDIATNKINIKVIQYGKRVFGTSNNKGVSWSQGRARSSFDTAINNIQHADTTTCNTCSQVYEAYGGSNSFEDQFSGRRNVPRFIVVLADGINGSETLNEIRADLARGRTWANANNAQIFFIRIGSSDKLTGSKPNNLSLGKSHFVLDNRNFFVTGSQGWNALDSVVPEITNTVCAA